MNDCRPGYLLLPSVEAFGFSLVMAAGFLIVGGGFGLGLSSIGGFDGLIWELPSVTDADEVDGADAVRDVTLDLDDTRPSEGFNAGSTSPAGILESRDGRRVPSEDGVVELAGAGTSFDETEAADGNSG